MLVTAFILAYIDEGPGGDKVGAVVRVAKEAIVSVEWGRVITESIQLITAKSNGTQIKKEGGES